jgi:hypothetical protein
MRLAHFVKDGQTRVGIVKGNSVYDLAESTESYGVPGLSGVSTIDQLLAKGLLDSVEKQEGRVRAAAGLPPGIGAAPKPDTVP